MHTDFERHFFSPRFCTEIRKHSYTVPSIISGGWKVVVVDRQQGERLVARECSHADEEEDKEEDAHEGAEREPSRVLAEEAPCGQGEPVGV